MNKCIPSVVSWDAHACNTRTIHNSCIMFCRHFFFFFLLALIWKVWRRVCHQPFFLLWAEWLEGHYSFLLASVSKLPGRSWAGQRCQRWGQLRAWLVWSSAGLAQTMLAALVQVRGGSKEWQLCQFNLYACSFTCSPNVPSFEPVIPEIDLLWLYFQVQDSVESAIWLNVWNWFLSLCTDLLWFLRGGGLLPRTSDPVSWCW